MWVRQCDLDARQDAPLPIPSRIASNEEFIPPPQSPRLDAVDPISYTKRRCADNDCGWAALRPCCWRSRPRPHLRHAFAQCRDQFRALAEMRLLRIEDARERALLQRGHVKTGQAFGLGGIADDVDQAIERVHASKQVVVLAIGA